MKFYDNTKLTTFKSCPRKYLMRHKLDWTLEGMPIAPGFGIAWHRAMDYIWENFDKEGDPVKLAQGAFEYFLEGWVDAGLVDPDSNDPDVWDRYKFRTPNTAVEIILKYIPARGAFLRRQMQELLYVEQPFVVPVWENNPDIMFCGRWDKVIRYEDKIWIVDHKTTSAYSRSSGIRDTFTESFSPDSQLDGYAYAARMLWGKEFGGIWIDGALVNKNHRHFCLIPVSRDDEHLDAWLEETKYWIDQIEAEEDTNGIWAKSTNSCFDWNSPCTYIDICKMTNTPQSMTRPSFLIEDKWSPFEHNNLVQLGLTED